MVERTRDELWYDYLAEVATPEGFQENAISFEEWLHIKEYCKKRNKSRGMKYIDADRLKAEIEKWKSLFSKEKENKDASKTDKLSLGGRIAMLEEILILIDSLQQEQQEVDLEKEIEKELRLHYNDDQDVYWWNYLKNSFRHFYKLGKNSK